MANWQVLKVTEDLGMRSEEWLPVFPGGEDKADVVHFVMLMAWAKSPYIGEIRHKTRRRDAGHRAGLLPDPRNEKSVPSDKVGDYLMLNGAGDNSAATYFLRFLQFQQHFGLGAVLEGELTFHQLRDKLMAVDLIHIEKPGVGQTVAKLIEMLDDRIDKQMALHTAIFGLKVVTDDLIAQWQAQDLSGFEERVGEEYSGATSARGGESDFFG